jgi:hypothetical protein
MRGKELFMFCGISFSRVISILIKILKRGSLSLLRDLPIARIQPTVLLELS